jgi:heme A synthase
VIGYIVGVLFILFGLGWLALLGLAARRATEPLPRRAVAALLLRSAFHVLLGAAFVVSEATSSPLGSPPLAAFVFAALAAVLAMNFVTWPALWRRLGDPNAWRGQSGT